MLYFTVQGFSLGHLDELFPLEAACKPISWKFWLICILTGKDYLTSEDEPSISFALQFNILLQVSLIAEGLSAVGHMLLISLSMCFSEARRVKIGSSL